MTDDEIKLYSWLGNPKTRYADGKLTSSQIDRLRLIGFEFENKSSVAWKNAYRYAEEYYKTNLNLASKYKLDNGFALEDWLARQRRNKSKLSVEQVKVIDSIGMVWFAPAEKQWGRGFEHLVQYKNKYGTAKLGADYRAEDGYTLGRWLGRQKKNFIDGGLNTEQIRRLTEIGVVL